MTEKKKRIIFAIIFIIICIGIGYLLYRVFFYKGAKEIIPTGGTTEQTTGGQLPTAGESTGITPSGGTTGLPTSGGITTGATTPDIVTTEVETQVSGMNIDSSGGVRFYNESDGKFYHQLEDGTLVSLSDKVFYNVDNITWAPTDNQAILEYPDGSNIYYNFDTNKQVTLPAYWEDFSFSNQSDQIVAKSMGLATENRWLITSDPDGKNIKLVEPMGDNANKVIVDWSPTRQFLAMSLTGEPLGDDRQQVLFVGQNSENFPSIIVEGYGLETQWSPSGDKLLYSVYNETNDYKPELWITDTGVDNMGANRTSLEINTWANKCTFSDSRFIYCAIPQNLPTGSGFAPSVADGIPDDIYKIDLKTGVKTKISTGSNNHTIDTISISGDKKTLYFTDKNQDGLLSIKL